MRKGERDAGKNGNGRAGVAALLINSFEFHVGRMLELESVIGAEGNVHDGVRVHGLFDARVEEYSIVLLATRARDASRCNVTRSIIN